MAKKTIDTSNWVASDTPTPTIDTSNWLPVETPIEQDFNIENVQKRYVDTKVIEEAARKRYDTRPEYAGLNKEEKEYLVKKEKEGALAGEDLARAAWTMAGNDPLQKKVASKDAKGNKTYSDLGELYKKGEEKGFLSSALTDIELSKYSGGNYYMKDRGDGTLVPVPLAYNEKPEAKDVKNAQVFSSLDDDAYGDSRFIDVAKKAWNIIPAVAQGFVSIPETVQGLVTGKTGKGYEVTKNVLEAAKFKTAQKFQEGIIDSQKIDEFSDFLSKDVYDLSPDKIINTVVNVASSLGEFAVTRKLVPIKGKVGTFAAGTVMNIKEPLQAAEDAGVEGRAKYAVAATYALAASGLETALGIEGKIFDDAATTAKKQMINKIIKDNVEVVGGKLTKESVENLYKETLKEVPSFYSKYLKNTVGEVTEEVAQNMIQNGTQEIHDILMKDDPEAAKFNTKFWSPEALAEYMNSAFGGLIGGVAGSRFVKNKQSETAYDAIKNGKESDLKAELASSLKEGRLTQDDYNRAVFKINSYKEYYEATKDRNVTDDEKRKIFDLTYEKENTKSGLENIKQNNPGGINDGLIAAKEQELRDYTQQINDIWSTAEARTSTSPVEEAKAQVPQWKTDLDTFSKEVGNADKQVSQNFVTKDKIETAVGASPQLNELAKPFSVDFKAPHLPDDAGNIQIRDGVLYEPYLEKQEGKEDVVKTRQLPVYAMEDKDGGTWLFASGEKTDLDAPDVSYLIKLNEEGGYEGHQEFKYETAKKNELTFDDIVPTFNKLGIKTASLTDEIKGLGIVPEAEFEEVEDIEMEAEYVAPIESEQFKNVYEKVRAGVGKAKLKLLPNNTVGVTIDGEDVPFASQRFLNKEDLPSGDVEVNVRTVENIEGKYGRGVLIETQEGVPLGYIRRAGKVETGRIAAEKISPTEDVDIDVPVELTDAAKEKIQQIEKDQENYELVEDELGRRYVNKKTGESYASVSAFVSGKSGGDFKGDKRLKETAFKVGNIINGIVKDFFNGTIKSYSNYAENISRDDYDDIVRQLQDVLEYAKDKGYSIVTKPLIIADDVNKIAGQPNVLMVDENGKFYVYDVATLRNKQGVETKELLNKRYKDRPTNAERISAQVNILADILNNKYGLEVGKVGVIPFDVDYEVAKEGQPVQITQATRAKRVDFKRKQILKPTGKTSAAEVKEKVAEVKPVKETKKEKEYEQKGIEEKGAGKPSEEVQAGNVKEIRVRRRKIGVPKSKRKIRNKRILEIVNRAPNNPFEAVLIEFIKGTKLNTYAFQSLFGNKLDVLKGKKISKSALAEAKIRVAFWNNKIGLTIKDLAHKLWERGDTEFYTDGDYREAIEQVMLEYPTLSSMIEYFNTLDQVDKEAAEQAEMNVFLAGIGRDGIYPEELEDYWNGLTPEQQEAIANDNIIPDDFENYIEEELTSEETEEEIKQNELKDVESTAKALEGKDIVREEGDEEYPFQKAKSVKSIFDESVKLFYKIRGTEGAAKKRNLTQERKELLKENPSVRFIDNNISSIFEQLEKKGIIKRKGDCP
jgi:hypothetical protein